VASTAATERRGSPARLYDGLIASDALIAKAVRVSEVSQIAKLEQRLFEYVAAEWRLRRKKAAKKAGEMAERGASSSKIAAAVGRIMRPWARAIQARFNREIKEIYRLARIASHKKATKQIKGSLQFNSPHVSTEVKKALQSGELLPSFDLIDDATVASMNAQNTLWIGEHYDKNVVAAINEETRAAVEAGTVGRQAGRAMSARVNDTLSQIKVPKGFTGSERQYFEGLVANAATNARAQGQIRSFASLGVTQYEIVNPGDERTCPVCSTMDGKVFSIKQGVDQVANDLNANTPDDVRAAHPWPSVSTINGNEKKGIEPLTKPGPQGPEDAKKLADKGFALPPYHFRCRCTVDVAEESLSFESLGDPISVDALVRDIGRAGGVASNLIPPATAATTAAASPLAALPKTPVTPTQPYTNANMNSALSAKPEGIRVRGQRSLQFSEAQQATIRKELNALVGETGMVNQDIVHRSTRSRFKEYWYRTKKAMGKASGVHTWTGAVFADIKSQAGARRFLKRITSRRALGPAT
jgi:SPP1 gp7 family putative phage head morphogenesis protein